MEFDDVVDETLDDSISFDHLSDAELMRMLDTECCSWLAMALEYDRECDRYFANFLRRSKRNPSIRRGLLYMQDAIGSSSGDGDRAHFNFRILLQMFVQLICYLHSNFDLPSGTEVDMYEQVAMFLYVLVHGMGLRQVQSQFGQSLSTISGYFTNVLHAVVRLAAAIIKPHPDYNDSVQHHCPTRQSHNVFKDCIGAIDGTHVRAVAKTSEAIEWIGRKGFPSQNVLAVCDFNLCFTVLMAGHCGRVHDARLLAKAIADPCYQFPHPGPGKYYLVDSDFSNKTGYLAPYKGTNIRYHFQEFRHVQNERGRAFRNDKERFNFTHSSCRNIIERAFGVLKQRWKILDRMGRYIFDKQVAIVLCCMALHNYLRRWGYVDEYFRKYDDLDNEVDPDEPDLEEQVAAEASSTEVHLRDEWVYYRDTLSHQLASRRRGQ